MGRIIKMAVSYGFSAVLLCSVFGCASVKRGSLGQETKEFQIQQLQARINELEGQCREKDEDICYLEDELAMIKEEKKPSRAAAKEFKTFDCTPKNIQTALKNSGFYKGRIDGKIGKGTKKAIRKFQKANALSGDGVVGKRTWMILKKYLSK